jgi:hypothetical protein
MDVPEGTEEGVAVCSDTDIPFAGSNRGSWNVSGTDFQNACVVAFEDHHRKVKARYFQLAKRIAAANSELSRRLRWRCWKPALAYQPI